MLSTPWTDRRGNAERIAARAWDQLVSAVESAGGSVRGAADEAGGRVGSVKDEAWHRANAAFDALAGRKPSTPWPLVIGIGLLGAAIGWAAGTAARAALSRTEAEERIDIVEADPDRRAGAPVALDT